MADALSRLRALHAARHVPAATGGRGAVGCISHAVPVELVLAAGLRPVRLHGDPSRLPGRGARYMEDEAEGEVRSIFDRMIAGEFANLDLILLPRASEMLLQLHYYIAEVRRWEAQARIPEVVLVDVMQTAFWSTGRYVRDRLDELAVRLGAVGSPVSDDSLRSAISTTNEVRQAFQRLNALRREGRIRGSDLHRAAALYGTIPADELCDLLRALADESGEPASGPRVVVSGSQPDDTGVLELIEAAGAHVAADDFVAGERLFAHLVDEEMSPMEALTAHYQLRHPGLRQFPQAPQDRRFLATAVGAGVSGHICLLEDGDDTLGWDYPPRRRMLDEAGIPSLLLAAQDYFAPDRAVQARAVRDFLATLRGAAA